MLAAISSHSLAIIETPALKSANLDPKSLIKFDSFATALAWTADNSALFVAAAGTLRRYDSSGNYEKDVYTCNGSVSCMVVKDNGNTIIFALGTSVRVLECGSGNISTLDNHDSPITSLSLSQDGTLLAATSSASCTVYNLSLTSHSAVRGWPAGQQITASTFHPHTRTRLLLGCGSHLLIYDTSRPSGPLKSISLATLSGGIVAIACSPFSKTLVAVACVGGSVGLVDLEKEKGLFKTLDMKVPLTAGVFSQDGGAILLGTENGKLLTQDLRGLDRPPKSWTINEDGERIVGMTIQKKMKSTTVSSASSKAVKANDASSKALVPHNVNSPASARQAGDMATKKYAPAAAVAMRSPLQRRTVATVRAFGSPAARRVPSTFTPGKARKAIAHPESAKQIFSPMRVVSGASEGVSDISVQIETLTGGTSKTRTTPKSAVLSPTSSSSSKRPPLATTTEKCLLGASRVQAGVSGRARSTSASASAALKSTSSGKVAVADGAGTRTRTSMTRTVSAGSSKASPPPVLSAGSTTSRAKLAGTGLAPVQGRERTLSSVSTRARPVRLAHASGAGVVDAPSRTPSPDLPSPRVDPETPLPTRKRGAVMGLLGLATPEVEAWARAGDGPPESKDGEDEADIKGKGRLRRVGFFEETTEAQVQAGAMQVSPRRPAPVSSGSTARHLGLSPLRTLGLASPARTGAVGAPDLLRAVVRDVMYEFRQEAREEVVGLHLDLVRLGRGWKSELRALMDEYVGDLRELREENQLLREENERLRRGY